MRGRYDYKIISLGEPTPTENQLHFSQPPMITTTRSHKGETKKKTPPETGPSARSREVTADDLNRLRLLQLNAADLETVLILLEVAGDGKWVPGKPILHGKTANVLVLLFSVVLDIVDDLDLVFCEGKGDVRKVPWRESDQESSDV